MKKIFVILITMVSSLLAWAEEETFFTIFNRDIRTAYKLYNIDVSYNASFSIFKELDTAGVANIAAKRFNFFHNDTLFVVYGEPNSLSGKRDMKIFCFETEKYSSAKYSGIDTSIIRMYSALASEQDSIIYHKYTKKNIDANIYIINDSSGISVFIVPVWQRNGKIIYGNHVFRKYSVNNNVYTLTNEVQNNIGYKVFDSYDSDIYLNYAEDENPSPVAILYSLVYKDIFPKIVIETKKMYSILNDFDLGSFSHIRK